MGNEVYDRLIDALAFRGGAIYPQKVPAFFELLEELFTPEEAELACLMPLERAPVERIAEIAGRTVEESLALLDSMANKGLVFHVDKGGTIYYRLNALGPGIFEYQFMSGEVSERTKKLARLFEECSPVTGKESGAYSLPTFPFSRVLPVEKEIETGVNVQPYEKVSEYIKNAEHISVSTCYCRHHAELVENPCDKPKETCITFGPSAKFVAERGFGRLVSKEEALHILELSEEAGLVHCANNTSKYLDFMCNCCICHCAILQHHKDLTKTNIAAPSNYVAEVDRDSCDSCEICLDRCPMEALSMDDDTIKQNTRLCIGCGLCVSTCPQGSLKMVPREELQTPPRDVRELEARMIESIQQNK